MKKKPTASVLAATGVSLIPVTEASSPLTPAPGPHGRCWHPGPSWDFTDPERSVWRVPMRCQKPWGHSGICGYADDKPGMVLIARWDEDEARPIAVEGAEDAE